MVRDEIPMNDNYDDDYIEDGTDAALKLASIIARLKKASYCLEGLVPDYVTLRAVEELLLKIDSETDSLLDIAEDCFNAAEADKEG